MRRTDPVLLLITTQSWRHLPRLARRFLRHGAKLSVLCPADSELRELDALHSCHVLQPRRPLASIVRAIYDSESCYLIPGDDLAVWLLQDLSERFPRFRRLVERSIGPRRSANTVRSRAALLALAKRLDIEVPACAATPSLEDAKHWSRVHAGPFLLKKDGTWGGLGVAIIEDAEALAPHYTRLEARTGLRQRIGQWLRLRPAPIASPNAQTSRARTAGISAHAYIKGAAANAMFACNHGAILGAVQARVIAARGQIGPAVLIDLIDDRRIARAGERLAAALQLSGFFGLDFILEENTGVPFLIEMNPRCTQMGDLALPRQPDLAGLLWSRWSGCAPPPVIDSYAQLQDKSGLMLAPIHLAAQQEWDAEDENARPSVPTRSISRKREPALAPAALFYF